MDSYLLKYFPRHISLRNNTAQVPSGLPEYSEAYIRACVCESIKSMVSEYVRVLSQ